MQSKPKNVGCHFVKLLRQVTYSGLAKHPDDWHCPDLVSPVTSLLVVPALLLLRVHPLWPLDPWPGSPSTRHHTDKVNTGLALSQQPMRKSYLLGTKMGILGKTLELSHGRDMNFWEVIKVCKSEFTGLQYRDTSFPGLFCESKTTGSEAGGSQLTAHHLQWNSERKKLEKKDLNLKKMKTSPSSLSLSPASRILHRCRQHLSSRDTPHNLSISLDSIFCF